MRFFNFFILIAIINYTFPTFARCAVCYTNGLSGASIALIVIISSFLLLFFANMFLRKVLDKKKL